MNVANRSRSETSHCNDADVYKGPLGLFLFLRGEIVLFAILGRGMLI